MAATPEIRALTGVSVDVLNAIRNNATQNYKDYVPVATADANVIKEIGAIIMDYPALRNEFIDTLMNRIAYVYINSKTYDNPWAVFKKGIMEFGESVEEIFVELAKPFQFDMDTAEDTLFKKQMPDVRTAFHVLNYKKFYKITVSNEEVRRAFLSIDGVTDLISRIVERVYTSANYDEYLVMKYMVAKHISEGMLYPVEIDTVSSANMKSIVATIKAASNNLTFMSDKYNLAHVHTTSTKDEQYLLINAKFDAQMDVEVLASAFNMDKAEFMGHRILFDGFANMDMDRLNELFEYDETYTELSAETLEALDAIPVILLDKSWFMIYDNLLQMEDVRNGEGLYFNYFYHTWKTFSVSPFANNSVFIPSEPTVTSITLSPASLTLSAGDVAYITATVATTNFAPKTVTWSTESDIATVDSRGKVIVSEDAEAEDTITITCTSDYDNTVTATCTITIA